MSGKTRLVFVATGDIALPSFRSLLDSGRRPLALVTQPDRPAGRRLEVTPSRIKTAALEAGIPVLQPEKIGAAADQLKGLQPDYIVVMAYGQILKDDILTLPAKAIINLHASLLPKYRGAACIQAAIDSGDAATGMTSMHVVRELDAGDMIIARKIPIRADDTGGSLHDRLADLAVEVLAETLALLDSDSVPRIPQDAAIASYVSKLERGDGLIDWSRPAEEIERRIRAYDPWPGTFAKVTENGRERRLKILPPTKVHPAAAEMENARERLLFPCGSGSLEVFRVQPEGGRICSAAEYLRGRAGIKISEMP
ncbi:MAG: methionyl-tRNA formyltransferase [Verrucomicrobiota bacterium]